MTANREKLLLYRYVKLTGDLDPKHLFVLLREMKNDFDRVAISFLIFDSDQNYMLNFAYSFENGTLGVDLDYYAGFKSDICGSNDDDYKRKLGGYLYSVNKDYEASEHTEFDKLYLILSKKGPVNFALQGIDNLVDFILYVFVTNYDYLSLDQFDKLLKVTSKMPKEMILTLFNLFKDARSYSLVVDALENDEIEEFLLEKSHDESLNLNAFPEFVLSRQARFIASGEEVLKNYYEAPGRK